MGEQDLPGSPLVSVIIPVYRVSGYLDQCVASVLEQTYAHLDVVLVNDGCPDGGGERCDYHAAQDGRIRVLHQTNGGLSVARNSGLRASEGELVMFLDGDDWLASDAVETLVSLLRADDSAGMSACGMFWTSGEKTIASDRDGSVEIISGEEFLRAGTAMLPVNPLSACAKLFRRHLLDGIWFPEGRLHEDVFVTHRMYHRAGTIAYTRRRLYYYRQREGSITSGEPSVRSKIDKARAHLERSRELKDMGILDVALREFKHGFAWHLRAMGSPSPHWRALGPAEVDELEEQRLLVTRAENDLASGAKLRVAVMLYLRAPRTTARLYVRGLRVSKRLGQARTRGSHRRRT